MKYLSILAFAILAVYLVQAEIKATTESIERPNLKKLWAPNGPVEEITDETYVEQIVNSDPDQMWLLLFAKTGWDDFSIRAKKIYDELAPENPNINFAFVDIHKAELVKVAFDVESIPWTYCIFGKKAYRFPALEQKRTLQDWLDNPEQWKHEKNQ